VLLALHRKSFCPSGRLDSHNTWISFWGARQCNRNRLGKSLPGYRSHENGQQCTLH